jgi:SWI/SNF-related matrix-associated actin-dependent regulator 1 of chromatin subfamily A
MVNKYSGRCHVCHANVGVGDGEVHREHGAWITYCQAHVPAPRPTRRCLTGDGCIIAPYEADNLDLYRSMPGARWDRDSRCWRVSLDIGDRARLLELADRLKLDVAPELRQVAQSTQAERASREGLYPFQITGVDWLSKRKQALLGDEMGLGKTVEVLAALPEKAAVLVVTPANVKWNWAAECRKWRSDLTPVVLRGQNSFRWPQPGELVIVNYDILPEWLESEDGNAARDVILVVDEAHWVKNRKTARAKRISGLAQRCGRAWGLTGTPLENRPPDLWGTLQSLGMAQVVFRSWTHFVDLFCGKRRRYGGYEWGKPKEIVPELLRRVMLRRRRTDVLPELPKKTYSTVVCDLNGALRARLDGLWEKWKKELTTGVLPRFEEFSEVRAQLAADRITVLENVVAECEEQDVPVVVFSAHVEPVRVAGRRNGWAYIDGSTPDAERQRIVEQFQGGQLKGVALSIRAGGVGLTLTRAWKAVFVDLDWTPAANMQAEDRLCRIGQENPHVEIVHLVSDHPLDCRVMELLTEKTAIIDAAVEYGDNNLTQHLHTSIAV